MPVCMLFSHLIIAKVNELNADVKNIIWCLEPYENDAGTFTFDDMSWIKIKPCSSTDLIKVVSAMKYVLANM